MTHDTDPCEAPTIPCPADWEPPPESSRYIETPDAPRVCTQKTWKCAESVPSLGQSLEALCREWFHSDSTLSWCEYVLFATGYSIEQHLLASGGRR